MKLKIKFFSSVVSMLCFMPLAHASQTFEELKEELGLAAAEFTDSAMQTHLYIVHHGDTLWTEEERLQGWTDIPLSDAGREQMCRLAEKLATLKVDVIYSSDLSRAVESAHILQKIRPHAVLITDPALRGESHGSLEGLKKEEYEKDPHYLDYTSRTSEERIFFPVGPGGLSKADVARAAIPKLQEICRKHPGQNVLIVTHGGTLKFLNFLLGNHTLKQISEVPHGEMLCIDGDSSGLLQSMQ